MGRHARSNRPDRLPLAFVGGQDSRSYKGWLVAGWVLLGIYIFLNWLLIKSMLSVAAAAAPPRETWTKWHYRMLAGVLTRQKVYGSVQNAAFLLGVPCIGLGYSLNL